MHENLSTTDEVYGILSERDVRDTIAALGTRAKSGDYDLATLHRLMGELKAAIARISLSSGSN